VRLFIAIHPEESTLQHVERISRFVQGRVEGAPVRWLPASQLHLTLKFLGELDALAADDLRARLRDVHWRQFTLGIDRLELLPPRGTPRIVGLGIGGQVDELRELQDQVESAAAAAGVSRDTRPFLPHVTIGRVKDESWRLGRTLRDLELPAVEARLTWRVASFELMHSQLSSDGPDYRLLERYPLQD
jgi:2'-5' RNA ligase